MKECPKCGYKDSLYWRPAFADVERDIIEMENLEREDPPLAWQLKKSKVTIIGQYAYHLTKTGKWVERLYLPVFKARKESFTKPKQYNGAKKSQGRLEAILRANRMIPSKDATLA